MADFPVWYDVKFVEFTVVPMAIAGLGLLLLFGGAGVVLCDLTGDLLADAFGLGVYD